MVRRSLAVVVAASLVVGFFLRRATRIPGSLLWDEPEDGVQRDPRPDALWYKEIGLGVLFEGLTST